jgi:hypothetical protein
MRQIGMASVVGVGAVLCVAGLALGQNALGDGRALDRNTIIGGTGANEPTRDYLAEFRFRNALVTGNVPGGMGFRGATGYGLEYDFRQRVGSDDLFSFRRDSFTSGLAGTGIRGTEALQYQFALTVGNAPPRNLRGSLLTSRTGDRLPAVSATAPMQVGDGTTDLREATAEEAGRFEPGTLLSLRSISAFTADRSLGPTMLQMGEDGEGQTQGLVASPLRGLARELLLGDSESDAQAGQRQPGDQEAGEEDQAEPRDRFGRLPSGRIDIAGDVRARLAEDFESRSGGVAQRREGEQSDPSDAAPGREGAAGEPGPAGTDARAGMGMETGDPFMARLGELQRVLRDGLLVEGGAAGETGASEGAAQAPSERVLAERIQGWDQLVTTLKTGVGTVEVPSPKLDRASAYDLHIERAQTMMRQGQYFEAEQRFTMALATRPGDAIASIGRVHAQIGAGLDLSAAVNLRNFLIEHPEFVAARYQDGMLPTEDRLESASRRLRAQLADRDGPAPMRESALLLAYVSFQRGDVVSLALGLERLAEGRAGQRDAIVPLLRAVWQDGERPRQDDGAAAEEGSGER